MWYAVCVLVDLVEVLDLIMIAFDLVEDDGIDHGCDIVFRQDVLWLDIDCLDTIVYVLYPYKQWNLELKAWSEDTIKLN